MGCLVGLESLLIWVVVICAVFAIVRLLLGFIPVPPVVVQIFNILLWMVVAIACIYAVFRLIGCVLVIPLPR